MTEPTRGSRTSDRPVQLAILGLGSAGRVAARAAQRSPHVELVALCDLDRERAGEFADQYHVRAYSDASQLCRDTEIEAVYIATPTYLHLANALQLAASGKHLLVEKPVAKDQAEGDALVRLHEEYGVQIMAVNTRGGDAAVRAIARIVASGAIGRVLSLTNICYTNWTLRPRYHYELLPALGGGVTFRQAPHQVEIARTIVRAPALAVTALAGASATPVDTIGNYSALVEFVGGVSATLVYNGYGYFDTAELTYGVGEGGRPADRSSSKEMRAAKSWALDKYGASGLAARAGGAGTGDAEGTERSPWSFVGLTLVSGERGDLRQSERGVTVYDESGPREEECLDEPGGLAVDFAEFHGALRLATLLEHDATWGATTVRICQAIWTSHNERRRVEL